MDDSNVRGCSKAVCLNQNTAIDHLLLPDDRIISYGAKSAVGAKADMIRQAKTAELVENDPFRTTHPNSSRRPRHNIL